LRPIETVDAGTWREAVSDVLEGGSRFATAWAAEGAWRAAFVHEGVARVLSCPAEPVDTIVDLVEAAGWDEREAHDLHGLAFAGHSPLRALVAHPADGWVTPVSGDGVHEVAVGPIHAGVIESGHFRFHTVGDRVLAMDPRLFYKHRGLEAAALGREPEEALTYVQRACAACSVANGVAYAHAVEDALGLWPDRDLRVARTLALELERLYNHLHDIGALCAGVGFAVGTMSFAALKERAQRLNAALAGHRFLFGSVALGRGALTVSAGAADRARGQLRELRADAAAAWRELEFASSLQARLYGVGVLARADALRLGATGPAARAAGVREDVREHSPRLFYGDLSPARPHEETGDVAARLQVRATEVQATCELLDELLSAPVARGRCAVAGDACPHGIGQVECPRGTTTCAVELRAGRVSALRLRTASFANWPAVAHAAAGCLLPDFPLINKSFELCYACVDR
jgi:Ni,Fe-hydrogenase III large subunit